MMTHDDAYVDIDSILLTSRPWFDSPMERLFWGRFRHNRPVPAFGEGREIDFKAPVYPKHACDGAYVIGSDLARWIARNGDMLHTFGVSILPELVCCVSR